MQHPFDGDNLHPMLTAADYLIAAIGREKANLLGTAFQAGIGLTEDERQAVRPLADAILWLIEAETGQEKTYTVDVRGFDRQSVLKVVATSEAEAREKALEQRNIRAKVLSSEERKP